MTWSVCSPYRNLLISCVTDLASGNLMLAIAFASFSLAPGAHRGPLLARVPHASRAAVCLLADDEMKSPSTAEAAAAASPNLSPSPSRPYPHPISYPDPEPHPRRSPRRSGACRRTPRRSKAPWTA